MVLLVCLCREGRHGGMVGIVEGGYGMVVCGERRYGSRVSFGKVCVRYSGSC